MAHIYNGTWFSHKKKRNWVIFSEVSGPRVCHTEWSKSEREKQILYANVYIYRESKKKKSGTDEPSGRARIKRKTQRMDEDTGWEGEAGAK